MPSSYTISRKANFATACKKYKIPKALSSNPDFEAIFDILNRDDSIIAAICKCEEKNLRFQLAQRILKSFVNLQLVLSILLMKKQGSA